MFLKVAVLTNFGMFKGRVLNWRLNKVAGILFSQNIFGRLLLTKTDSQTDSVQLVQFLVFVSDGVY